VLLQRKGVWVNERNSENAQTADRKSDEGRRVESNRDSVDTDTKLKRIAWLSAHDPKKKFDQLMHHFNEGSLSACFHELDGKKAVGIDGIEKSRYGENLDDNLKDLI
jgi:hypothetical protein